jgi:hypothetical protein
LTLLCSQMRKARFAYKSGGLQKGRLYGSVNFELGLRLVEPSCPLPMLVCSIRSSHRVSKSWQWAKRSSLIYPFARQSLKRNATSAYCESKRCSLSNMMKVREPENIEGVASRRLVKPYSTSANSPVPMLDSFRSSALQGDCPDAWHQRIPPGCFWTDPASYHLLVRSPQQSILSALVIDAIGECISGDFRLSHQLVSDLDASSKTPGSSPSSSTIEDVSLRHLALMGTVPRQAF